MQNQEGIATTFEISSSERGEKLPLLKKGGNLWKQRYHNTNKCINSKAALIILLWYFIVMYAPTSIFFEVAIDDTFQVEVIFLFLQSSSLLFFYPLAGFLADVKFGRYKTVVRSLYVLVAVIVIITSIIYGTKMGQGMDIQYFGNIDYSFLLTAPFEIAILANIIQFGMDQLHDSPGDHQSLFIHWYVWVYYLAFFLSKFRKRWSYHDYYVGVGFVIASIAICIIILTVSFFIAYHKQKWFLIDKARVNPYKLVYKITKFARKNKVPIQRSAFTFCEDEIPSGLDLGKEKYGGPFTTEEVEDVKVFYGILKVLFAFGPAFLLDAANEYLLGTYARHGSMYTYNETEIEQYNNDFGREAFMNMTLLSPLLVIIGLPIYLCLLRPFLFNHIPNMLTRMGLGMTIIVLSLTCTLIMDTANHNIIWREIAGTAKYDVCMFSNDSDNTFVDSSTPPLRFQDTYLLVVQQFLSALSNMLIYVALYEFICSQSPHTMKGLLIGLSFAIQGIFKTIAYIFVLPFHYTSSKMETLRPVTCGMYYYIVHICMGFIAVPLYVYVARRYKYRERDEPCHVRRYVEEYYSKVEEEQFYDYD